MIASISKERDSKSISKSAQSSTQKSHFGSKYENHSSNRCPIQLPIFSHVQKRRHLEPYFRRCRELPILPRTLLCWYHAFTYLCPSSVHHETGQLAGVAAAKHAVEMRSIPATEPAEVTIPTLWWHRLGHVRSWPKHPAAPSSSLPWMKKK